MKARQSQVVSFVLLAIACGLAGCSRGVVVFEDGIAIVTEDRTLPLWLDVHGRAVRNWNCKVADVRCNNVKGALPCYLYDKDRDLVFVVEAARGKDDIIRILNLRTKESLRIPAPMSAFGNWFGSHPRQMGMGSRVEDMGGGKLNLITNSVSSHEELVINLKTKAVEGLKIRAR